MADTVTDPAMPSEGAWVPPDQAARDRIREDLATNLLVEAGAGSGKTTAMAGRMVELVRTGAARVDQIAAVTFTRKAAAELRERFQERLEVAYRELVGGSAATGGAARSGDSSPDLARLAEALRQVDGAFIGTIHSFCARLLREKPLEARVPPGFREISDAAADRLRAESWSRFLETLAARRSRLLPKLDALGLSPAQLTGVFREISENPDVVWRSGAACAPSPSEIEPVRRALESLLTESRRLMPADEPGKGWDDLQRKIRSLGFRRYVVGWDDDARFFDALDIALGSNKIVQNRWGQDRESKQAAKALAEKWTQFGADGSPGRSLLDQWLAYRYPTVLRFARAGAAFYARERVRTGQLDWGDLLMLSARLLRTDDAARRELGERYRFLLVDEFQDTDPLQAEVVFLLTDGGSCGGEWSRAVPRPGALFVVGDPKQSIYRFRRADISVYNRVKRRFAEFGAVVPLVANFRSTAPIATLVNRVFDAPEALPREETEYQARFAPLRVKPGPRPGQGVYWYAVTEPAGSRPSKARITRTDASVLAGWIDARIRSGERRAGDFLVLTRRRSELVDYARALETRGIAVRVSGARVGVSEELWELLVLLRALADPANEVLTLAALEGLFFGLSHEDLYDHRRNGGGFRLADGATRAGPVGEALSTLRQFWSWTRREPADVAVPMIVERLGLLPFATAGELGGTRGGALLYAMDALRVAALDGQTSLAEAIEVLEVALEAEADTPLIPGATDAVRLMNLHKAKGLEAPVVVLACPITRTVHDIERHVVRGNDGRARGWMVACDPRGGRNGGIIARPPNWAAFALAEEPYRDAEEVRLLYVAATRAADELVIARCDASDPPLAWGALDDALDAPGLATELTVLAPEPHPREELRVSSDALAARARLLEETRERLSAKSYYLASATSRVHGRREIGAPTGERSARRGRGPEWGTAVHRALEAAGRGIAGDELRNACADLLRESGGEVDAMGRPIELDELLALVDNVRESALWRRAARSDLVLLETPFAVAVPLDRLPPEAITSLGENGNDAAIQAVEGVIDLAFRERGGWVVADYKSDVFSSVAQRSSSTGAYRRQVDLYARCWELITGEPVVQRILLFTNDLLTGHGEVSW